MGPDPLPEDHKRWIESWKHHHPAWEHRLWTEGNLPAAPVRPEVLERLRAPVERADILRLEILYRHGGVYVDTDLECLRPIDEVIAGEEFVAVCLKPGGVTNTLVAPAPGIRCSSGRFARFGRWSVYWTSRRRLLDQGGRRAAVAAAARRRLRRRGAARAASLLSRPRPRSVSALSRSTTWRAPGTTCRRLRTAMLQAERRLEAAKAELEKERRRHATTKKRLARIEGGSGRLGVRGWLAGLRRR